METSGACMMLALSYYMLLATSNRWAAPPLVSTHILHQQPTSHKCLLESTTNQENSHWALWLRHQILSTKWKEKRNKFYIFCMNFLPNVWYLGSAAYQWCRLCLPYNAYKLEECSHNTTPHDCILSKMMLNGFSTSYIWPKAAYKCCYSLMSIQTTGIISQNPTILCIKMVSNIMLPMMTLIFILLNLYFIVCSYTNNFNLFLVLIHFHIVRQILSLILILLIMLAWLSCLVYYIGY